ASAALPLTDQVFGVEADVGLLVAARDAELTEGVVSPTIGLALGGHAAGVAVPGIDLLEGPGARGDLRRHQDLGVHRVAPDLVGVVGPPAIGAALGDRAARRLAERQELESEGIVHLPRFPRLPDAASSQLAPGIRAPAVDERTFLGDSADVIVAGGDGSHRSEPLDLHRFLRGAEVAPPELAETVLSPAEDLALLGEAAGVPRPDRQLHEGSSLHGGRLGTDRPTPAMGLAVGVQRAGLLAARGDGHEAQEARDRLRGIGKRLAGSAELARVVGAP